MGTIDRPDLMDVWVAAIAALAALGGSIVGGLVTLKAGVQQSAHERQLEDARRKAEADQLRAQYQADTLIELQIAVHRLVRSATRIFVLDDTHHRQTGETYGRQIIGTEWSNEFREMASICRVLTSRVDADHVRIASNRVADLCSRSTLRHDAGEAWGFLHEAMDQADLLNDAIGAQVRGLPAAPTIRLKLVEAISARSDHVHPANDDHG